MIKKKIKLFVFNPYSQLGGTDLSLSRLFEYLKKTNNYEITYICLNKSKIKYKILNQIKVIKLKKERTLYCINDIKKILKKHKFDKFKKTIFISNQNFANIVAFFAFKKFKKLKTIAIERTPLHELEVFENIQKSFKSKIIKYLMKFVYPKYDLIICISNYIKAQLNLISNVRTKIIYNPSFFKKIKFKKKNVKYLRILNVGRLEKSKDQITILKAINLIKNKIPLKLIIIGYGSQRIYLQNFIKQNSLSSTVKIVFSKKPDYFYKKSDLFILSSKYEGFGNVLIEAASYNIPIISSRSGGPIEILSNGKLGKLFEVGDFRKLSSLIYNFYKKQDIKSIDKKFLNKYSISNLNKYNSIFKNI